MESHIISKAPEKKAVLVCKYAQITCVTRKWEGFLPSLPFSTYNTLNSALCVFLSLKALQKYLLWNLHLCVEAYSQVNWVRSHCTLYTVIQCSNLGIILPWVLQRAFSLVLQGALSSLANSKHTSYSLLSLQKHWSVGKSVRLRWKTISHQSCL